MKIKGFVLVGTSRDVDFYYSQTQNKFVDDIMKLNLGDLAPNRAAIDLALIKSIIPLIDKLKGIAKITIKIKFNKF